MRVSPRLRAAHTARAGTISGIWAASIVNPWRPPKGSPLCDSRRKERLHARKLAGQSAGTAPRRLCPLQGGGIQPLNLYGGPLGERAAIHRKRPPETNPPPPGSCGEDSIGLRKPSSPGRFLNGNAILAQDGNGQIHIALGLQRRGENNFAVAGKQRQGKQQARDKLRADVARQPVNTAFSTARKSPGAVPPACGNPLREGEEALHTRPEAAGEAFPGPETGRKPPAQPRWG